MNESLPSVATTEDLARELGLSRWAVSRALNGHAGVSAATRARVRAALARTGFEPNAHARGLRGGRTGLVGLALPAWTDPAWTALAAGLCEGLLVRGRHPAPVLTAGDPAGEARALASFVARGVEAVLMLGSTTTTVMAPSSSSPFAPPLPPAWAELRRRGVPVVLVEPTGAATHGRVTGAPCSDADVVAASPATVRTDHRAAAELVAAHLHAAGHHRVGLRGFGGSRERPRADALRAACATWGLTCGEEPQTNSTAASPRGRGRPGSAPTAFVATDDLTALRLLLELRAAGRAVPESCSLIGYGDDPAGALSQPALTTVDPQRSQLVTRTLELLDELRRWPPGEVEASTTWVAPLLRRRGSVAAPRS